MGISEVVNSSVSGLIEMVSGDTKTICAEAEGQSVAEWREAQIGKAILLGGGSAIIPIAGYLTLPADLAGTLRIMHRAATGISHINLGHADDDTFAGILAVWSGAVTLDTTFAKQMAAKTMAASAVAVGGKTGLSLAIKSFSIAANTIVAKKLGIKVSQKVAAKITQKLGVKVTTRWIPFLSAAASGGINWYFVTSLCDAAEEYCGFIRKHS